MELSPALLETLLAVCRRPRSYLALKPMLSPLQPGVLPEIRVTRDGVAARARKGGTISLRKLNSSFWLCIFPPCDAWFDWTIWRTFDRRRPALDNPKIT